MHNSMAVKVAHGGQKICAECCTRGGWKKQLLADSGGLREVVGSQHALNRSKTLWHDHTKGWGRAVAP